LPGTIHEIATKFLVGTAAADNAGLV
jgi:hypothetical protein